MLEKSSQFLSSKQPCEPKSLDVALKITGVEKCQQIEIALHNICLSVTLPPPYSGMYHARIVSVLDSELFNRV